MEEAKKPLLIGIAGPSCAGKTELATRLAEVLKAPILALDSYYRDLGRLSFEERARSNFDEPDALDVTLLTEHVSRLAQGSEIAAPVYDFSRHLRTAEVRPLRAADFVIIEGLFTLYWEEVRGKMQVKIFVGASEEVCLDRRLERDVRERGRTPESVREQFRATVAPMAQRYVLPTAAFADLVLNGTSPIEESVAAALALVRRKG